MNYTFNITLICLIGFLFLFSQCKTPKSNDQTESIELPTVEPDVTNQEEHSIVGKKWTHSREDDQNGNNYYLDGEKKTFPPSRFRNSLFFNDDGTCAYMMLSPTDRHHMVDGTYTYKANVITINQENGDEYLSYEVVEIAKDTLILKQIK